MEENRMFILKQKNHDVALMQFSIDGDIENFHVINPVRMPYLGSKDGRHLHEWWNNRSIPEGRKKLTQLLTEFNCKSPQEYLMKNLGLSLSDTYWISPAELELTWEDVNLFDNGDKTITFHDGAGKVQYSNKKDASLGGNLEKYSIRDNGAWYLDKYSDPKYKDGLQNVNEAFASMLHKKQGFKEYTEYKLLEKEPVCRCKYFTSSDAELVPAFEMTGGFNPYEEYDGTLQYNRFIDCCVEYGLERDYVENFMDYMLLTDYIITNSDRHCYNFGVLRNPETLKFISMAPIYDNGNSMFYNIYSPMSRASLCKLEDSGVLSREVDRLALVKNKNVVDASLLPTPKQVEKFYLSYGIDKERTQIIAKSYSNKLDLFIEYQHGFKISYATEMYDYISEVPVVKQKFNPKFFEERPE